MPLTAAELRELQQVMQTIARQFEALRDLVAEVYGADNRATESFTQTVESVKHLQRVLANPTPAELPGQQVPASHQASPHALAEAVEFVALSYLLDPAADTDENAGDDPAA
jgi:hypothetical protein